MNVITAIRPFAAELPPPLKSFPDPLDPDQPDDKLVFVTQRGLVRLALTAAEAGGRFARDGLNVDPMSWMLSPLRVFEGRTAMEACLEHKHCLRSVLMHGLSLGVDVDPLALDDLLADNDGEQARGKKKSKSSGANNGDSPLIFYAGQPRLYTAMICFKDDQHIINAFHAVITREPKNIHGHLVGRYGANAASEARIRLGFFPADPMVLALVPNVLSEIIRKFEVDNDFQRHENFTVDIEHRIAK